MSQDFKKHLQRQLGFLRRSCESFDAGYTDEAIRMATMIRVLIHDTGRSTSLLTHLGARDIRLASTSVGADPNAVFYTGMGRLTLSSTNATWAAAIAPNAIKAQLPLLEWWDQVVYVYGATRVSRKSLVLAAADKDGGAHVDAALTRDYETLTMTGQLGFFHYSVSGKPETFQAIMDAHLIYLRQIGHEILNSPELLALAQ